MPVVYLYPVSTISNDWQLSGAATAHEATDDPYGSEDGDGTFIFGTSSSPQNAYVEMTNMPPAGAIVNLKNRGQLYVAAAAGAFTTRNYVRIGGVDYMENMNNAYDVWQIREVGPNSLSPATGLPWTVPEINGAQGRLYRSGDFTILKKISATNWIVNYLMPTGSSVFLISQWLGPILAVASQGLSNLEILAILRRHRIQGGEEDHRKMRILPSFREEFEALKEASRRRPVYGFIGL